MKQIMKLRSAGNKNDCIKKRKYDEFKEFEVGCTRSGKKFRTGSSPVTEVIASHECPAWIRVKLEDVPEFLRNGPLFRNLQDNGDGDEEEMEATFPAAYCKFDSSLTNYSDLGHLLNTMKFWGSNDLPEVLIEFCMGGMDGVGRELKSFVPFLPRLTNLILVRKCSLRESRLVVAARCGDIQILRHLYNRYENMAISENEPNSWSDKVCTAAAANGHIDCLRFCREHGLPWSDFTFTEAWREGEYHKECIHYMMTEGMTVPTSISNLCRVFALNNDLLGLSIAHSQKIKLPLDVIVAAAWKGHTQCLEFALEHIDPSSSPYWATRVAAAGGQTDCLRLLKLNGFPINDQVLLYAAGGGHLQCLQWVHSQVPSIRPMLIMWAAAYGHLNCVKYLHEQQCPWDQRCVQYAAGAGQLDCLRYLHESGCPWDVETTRCALGHGRFVCLEYAINNGCAVDIEVFSAYQKEREARERLLAEGKELTQTPLTYRVSRRMLLLNDRLPKWCSS